MAAKTYLPTLVRMLRRLCVYIVRWGPQLRANLTPTGRDLLDTIMATCEALIEDINLPIGD